MTRVFGLVGSLCILLMACGGGKPGFSSTDELAEFLEDKGVTCWGGEDVEDVEELEDDPPYLPVARLNCGLQVTNDVWLFESSGHRDEFASSETFRDAACWDASRGYIVRESNVLAWSEVKRSSIEAIATAFGREVETFKC